MSVSSTTTDFPGAQAPSLATDHPNLGKAPIREALIDLRVRLGRDVELAALAALADSLAADYPERTPIHQFHGQIGEATDEIAASVSLATESSGDPRSVWWYSTLTATSAAISQ